MRLRLFYFLLCFLFTFQLAKSQSKFSLMTGGFYNGNLLIEDAQGVGLILGLEYEYNHFISIEMRTRYGLYSFDEGTSWKSNDDGTWSSPQNKNKPRIKYLLFSPKIGIVPKFHLSLEEYFDGISLFLENEFSIGLMSGTFEYNGQPYAKKSFTEPIFCYNVGLGVEFTEQYKLPLQVSLTYSTLNFRNKILKHQPESYQGWIPDQDVVFAINVLFKIPFRKK